MSSACLIYRYCFTKCNHLYLINIYIIFFLNTLGQFFEKLTRAFMFLAFISFLCFPLYNVHPLTVTKYWITRSIPHALAQETVKQTKSEELRRWYLRAYRSVSQSRSEWSTVDGVHLVALPSNRWPFYTDSKYFPNYRLSAGFDLRHTITLLGKFCLHTVNLLEYSKPRWELLCWRPPAVQISFTRRGVAIHTSPEAILATSRATLAMFLAALSICWLSLNVFCL